MPLIFSKKFWYAPLVRQKVILANAQFVIVIFPMQQYCSYLNIHYPSHDKSYIS